MEFVVSKTRKKVTMDIRPFRAFRYNEEVVGDVGNCVAPPYDVISPAQQQQLYDKSQYNIVRIIKGKTSPDDSNTNNQYTRAAHYFKTWIDTGALKQDPADAIYPYVQDFQLGERTFQRFSFIALARLEEFGKIVRPHERTLNEPIVDRLNLKRATGAKFGLPFILYEDPENAADNLIEKNSRNNPLMDFHDDNIRHRLFAITDRDDIGAITQMMQNKSCVIADGHHRYTTALAYSKENPNPSAQYQMLAFTNIRHEGLLILATHRLVGNLQRFEQEEFITALKDDFELTQYAFDSEQAKTTARNRTFEQMKAEHNLTKNAFGIYCGQNAFYVAVLKNEQAMDSATPDMSAAWRALDVAVLHKLILDKLLGIGQKQLAERTNVEYAKDIGNAVDKAIKAVDARQRQLVFFLNATRWDNIRSVTEAGEKMPQKSTYFYPKIYTGLTIDKL